MGRQSAGLGDADRLTDCVVSNPTPSFGTRSETIQEQEVGMDFETAVMHIANRYAAMKDKTVLHSAWAILCPGTQTGVSEEFMRYTLALERCIKQATKHRTIGAWEDDATIPYGAKLGLLREVQ